MRVVDAIARWFEVAGFKHYFGYAGGAVWPFLDALTDKPKIEGIQAKHESHAVHMADLYHRVSGRVAPVIVSKGPGLLNAVGACASAMHESSPVLIIAGGSTTHFLGKAGMQEIFYHGFEDAQSIFRPVCKGTWMLVRPDTTIEILNYAMKTATSGRPGPVFVEVPYDIQLAMVEGEIEAPGARAPLANRPRADGQNVERIARMIAEAERPLLLAGGGVVRSGAADALKAAAEKLNIPTATTLPAKGMLPEDHPLSIGTLGRSGFVCAARASREADLVIGVGARFSDNHTANWRQGSIYDLSRTKIVQVDLDYQEVGRNFPVELGLVSDAKLFLEDLAAASGGTGNRKHQDWIERTQGFRAEWEEEILPLQTASAAPTHPARLVHEVGRALPKDGRVYIDIGDVTQYAEAYMKITIARRLADCSRHGRDGLGVFRHSGRARGRRPARHRTGRRWRLQHDLADRRDRGGIRPAGDLGHSQQLRAWNRTQRHGAKLLALASLVSFPPQGHRRTLQPGLRRAGACLRRRGRTGR